MTTLREQFEAMAKEAGMWNYNGNNAENDTLLDLMQKVHDMDRNSILKNSLFMDNASEALYETIGEGWGSFRMLVCEAIDEDGNKYQLHIAAESDETQFVENNEEALVFGIDDDYRLVELPAPPTTQDEKK